MAESSVWFEIIVPALWVIVFLGMAAVSFVRFRNTPSGLLLGISSLLLAARIIVYHALSRTLMAGIAYHETPWTIFWVVSAAFTGICYTGMAVGIFMIPRSLARLARR
jgi:hypothetical protein